jgi:hypothetical protein
MGTFLVMGMTRIKQQLAISSEQLAISNWQIASYAGIVLERRRQLRFSKEALGEFFSVLENGFCCSSRPSALAELIANCQLLMLYSYLSAITGSSRAALTAG